MAKSVKKAAAKKAAAEVVTPEVDAGLSGVGGVPLCLDTFIGVASLRWCEDANVRAANWLDN